MITVQLQEADYLAAIRLHRRGIKKVLWTVGSILCYFVGGGVFLVYAPAEQAYWAYIIFGVGVGLAIFTTWMQFIGIPRGARRRFGEQKGLARQYTLSWNDEKLTLDGHDLHAGIPWTDFLKWCEDDQLFLLYSSRLQFRILPKRSFPDQATIVDFARLLHERIGAQGVARKS
jgi:hypothetical protein